MIHCASIGRICRSRLPSFRSISGPSSIYSSPRSFSSSCSSQSYGRTMIAGMILVGGYSIYLSNLSFCSDSSQSNNLPPSSSPSTLPSSSTSASSSPSLSDLGFSLVGNTPLVELRSLSVLLNRRIFVKVEYLSPGQSVKDRAARQLILEAEKTGKLIEGKDGIIVEATGGNTAISLALLANQRGYRTVFTMPETISPDKIQFMRSLGATVITCPPVPFSSPSHYYHQAAIIAEKLQKENPNIPVVFTNQFENIANCRAHILSTGPEIELQIKEIIESKNNQTISRTPFQPSIHQNHSHSPSSSTSLSSSSPPFSSLIDGVICSAGTGGTLSGLCQYFKSRNPSIRCALIDCSGSGLYSYVKNKRFESEGSSISEGIGIMRRTNNFGLAENLIDDAFKGSDEEIIEMAYYLLKNEGLFVGPSAALNVVGTVKLARKLPEGSNVVTVLCDGGDKYKHSLYNPDYLLKRYPSIYENKNKLPSENKKKANTCQDLSFVK